MRTRIMAGAAVVTIIVCGIMVFLGRGISGASDQASRLEIMGRISNEMTRLQRANAETLTGVLGVFTAPTPESTAMVVSGHEAQLASADVIYELADELGDDAIMRDVEALSAAMDLLEPAVQGIRNAQNDASALLQTMGDPAITEAAEVADAAKLALEGSIAARAEAIGASTRVSADRAATVNWIASLLLAVGGLSAAWVAATRITRRIDGVARALTAASDDLRGLGDEMGSATIASRDQSASAATAAAAAGSTVRDIATAVEQLGMSAHEIASTASSAREIAGRAVTEASSANDTMIHLSEASAEIGTVVQLIATVAEQTNLLALNATIEAARAGEAGRGFAVVASEVKELATQTSSATADIARSIASIQHSAGRAATAIGSITEIVNDVANLQTTIAAAVEEQSASVNEVAHAMERAAASTDAVIGSIREVAQSSDHSNEAVHSLLAAVERVSEETGALEQLVHTSTPTATAPAGPAAPVSPLRSLA
jgi:methyl-accepting chemotaxis protein